MNFSGKVTAVMQPRGGVSKAGKPWKTQDIVVSEEKEQYPQSILLSIYGDKIDQFNVKEGDRVSVQFNVTCRQYNGKFYNSMQIWALNKEGDGGYQQQYAGSPQQQAQQTPAQEQAANKTDISDLPF